MKKLNIRLLCQNLTLLYKNYCFIDSPRTFIQFMSNLKNTAKTLQKYLKYSIRYDIYKFDGYNTSLYLHPIFNDIPKNIDLHKYLQFVYQSSELLKISHNPNGNHSRKIKKEGFNITTQTVATTK